MNAIVSAAIDRWRTTLLVLFTALLAGLLSYINLPKEADPDIPVPFVYVGVPLEGASPEDAERLVVRPLETELRALEGVKELNCNSVVGLGYCVIEFEVNFDQDQALIDVRDKVDNARRRFPAEVDEWTVREFNRSLEPVLAITLYGEAPERTIYALAKELERELEAVPTILSADLSGAREEVLEIEIKPALLEGYDITYEEILAAVSGNNALITAGSLDTGSGRFQIKVPGLIESSDDLLNLPVRTFGDSVVRLKDVASVRRTFKNADSYARFNGHPAIVLQVVKRLGSNLIDATESARVVTTKMSKDWPQSIHVAYSLDQSRFIRDSMNQLIASVTTAILLVMILVVAALGLRSGLLVGFAIPGSFFLAFFLIGIAGMSINFMVLFGLVLAVGMLVDGAIVIVEYADRKMAEGLDRVEAYKMAGERMFWPVVSSTATTLAAFVPFLFWNSMPGKYMSFLPKTLILVLLASLAMALIFLPAIGALIGKRAPDADDQIGGVSSGAGDPKDLPGFTGFYAKLVARLVKRPIMVSLSAITVVVSVFMWFGATPHRTVFFLASEPEQVFVYVRARGNLAPAEQDALGDMVAKRFADVKGISSVYMTTGNSGSIGGSNTAPPDDTAVTLFVDFLPFGERPDGRKVMAEITKRVTDIPGVITEVRDLERGPPVGKDLRVQLSSTDPDRLAKAARQIRAYFDSQDSLKDVEDTLPLPGIEWQLDVDREQAGRFKVDIRKIGAAVQLITNGILVGRYRPDNADEELDIRLRFTKDARDISQLDRLRVTTAQGPVPISNFVTRKASPRVDKIARRNGQRVLEVRANAKPGFAANQMIEQAKSWLETANIPAGVQVSFRGADEETADAGAFFAGAMGASLFMMAVILLLQFNNFWHVFLTLQAVVLSITGVLIGIQLNAPLDYISVLMVGTGVVALAGIVVNNNIVLIDTYQHMRALGFAPDEAVVRTAAQRLRPVLLTTITTILGLLPMVFMINANFIQGKITYGGPAAEWWVPLAATVVWGLGFATLLTLILTPVLLGAPSRVRAGIHIFKALCRRLLAFVLKRPSTPAE
ncbi:MAG: transporter [Robiginitomaculum sp.]|nr:MAG: transporter [Robiginitomaculum sp.]